MIDYSAILQSVADKLAELYPDRVVTRTYRDFADHSQADLHAGVFTLIPEGIPRYPYERADTDAARTELPVFAFRLLGQGELAENATGPDVDAAEFDMIHEIEALTEALISDSSDPQHDQLCRLLITSVDQSAQLERPYYWIAARFELTNLL